MIEKIKNESEYSQALQRRKAIKEQLNQLKTEKTLNDKLIFGYLFSENWKNDREDINSDDISISAEEIASYKSMCRLYRKNSEEEEEWNL